MKTMIRNPFITSGYVSADYFCDRRFESEQLVREVMNGNNLALVSTRRMGKTGLIRHCFQFPEIKQGYYTFFIDIYDSRSLRDLVFALSKEILEVLKPMGKKALHGFWECVKSLQASISFDVNGMPSLNLGLGDIQAPATTLDEIFRYLEQADKPCLIAIDEFQ
jgi:AAA+ ATPase superfamily predicted ATPase